MHSSLVPQLERLLGKAVGTAVAALLEELQTFLEHRGASGDERGLADRLAVVEAKLAQSWLEPVVAARDESPEDRTAWSASAAQYRVVRALIESPSVAEALPTVLDVVSTTLGSHVGAVWLVSPSHDRLECVATWAQTGGDFEAFLSATRARTFSVGEGLPGRVWSGGASVLSLDVESETNFPRRAAARACDLHGAFAFPIVGERGVLGVIEGFSRALRLPDQELLQALQAVGRVVGLAMEREEAAAALQAAEQSARAEAERLRRFYESVLEGLPNDLAVFDLEGRYLYVNSSAIASPESRRWIIGRNDVEYAARRGLDPGIGQRRNDRVREVARTGETQSFDESFVDRSGRQRHFFRFASLVRDAAGRPEAVIGYGIDVTDRYRAAEELRASEERTRAVVENALDCVVTIDSNGRIIEFNPAAETAFGYRRDAALGQPMADLIIPGEHREAHRRGLARYLATGEGPLLRRRIEITAQRANGEIFPIELAITPIRLADGSAIFSGHLRDITARRDFERALAESERRYKEAVEASGVGLWEWHVPDGRFFISPEWFAGLGYDVSAVPVTGPEYLSYLHPHDRELVVAFLDRAVHQLDLPVGTYEYRIATRQGTWRWVQTRGRVVERGAQGEPLRVAGTNMDVTERKQAEVTLHEAKALAESASRAKSEFLANMSHEMRTPLNAIVGMTSLLAGTPLDQRQQDYIQTLEKSTRSLLSLVNDLLDDAAIAAGQLQLAVERFDLWEVVEDAVEQVSREADESGIGLGAVIGRNVPRLIEGDPNRLRQVLLNLLGNAVKFTPTGTVVIRVTLEEGVRLRFEVEDTGMGFNPSITASLFEPFVQADSSMTRRYGGTGLGLAISQRIVRLMGSSIEADSTPGRGSRFWFTLVPAWVGQGSTPEPAMTPVRIFLGAFAEGQARLLREMLVALGAHVVSMTARAVDAMPPATQHDLLIVPLTEAGTSAMASALWRQTPETRGSRIIVLHSPSSDLILGDLPEDVTLIPWPLLPRTALRLISGGTAAAAAKTLEHQDLVGVAQRGHLLVVEDNAANQKVAVGFLNRLGWTVDLASNGAEAISALQGQRYDAVLMDCQMPVMDGLTATREIRHLEPAGQHTPIIAMTASARVEDRMECLQAGMDDFIPKPVRQELLQAALERWTAAPPTTAASIETKALERLRGLTSEDGRELAVELSELFGREAPQTVATLRDAVADGRHHDVEHEAHRLKGFAMTLGAQTVAAWCRLIEESGRERRSAEAARLIDELDASVASAARELREEIRRMGSAGAVSSS